MKRHLSTLLTVGLLAAVPVLAKSKDKTLPPYILQARTVAVVIEPLAGNDPGDPRANQVAQKDVETALLNWGRFQPVIGTEAADLIIVIRRGHGRLVDATITDPRQNDRAGVINPTDNGVGVGAQHGTPPPLGGSGSPGQYPQSQYPQSQYPQGQSYPGQTPQPQMPHPEMEIGGATDSFAVFDGKVAKPLNGSPGWRYTAQDGLRPHNVPAVEEFRKAVVAAEKAAAAKNP